MSAVRTIISGGACADQIQHDVAAVTDAERQELLQDARTPLQIPVEETLAMKADLVLPWNKMRRCVLNDNMLKHMA